MEDECGLARAVGPEQRDPFAACDAEVDAEEGLVAVGVGEREPGDLQGGRGGGVRGDRGTGGNRGNCHSTHPSRHTASAATGRASAYDHCAREAVTSSMTGIDPAYPRLTIARCTRSPRS